MEKWVRVTLAGCSVRRVRRLRRAARQEHPFPPGSLGVTDVVRSLGLLQVFSEIIQAMLVIVLGLRVQDRTNIGQESRMHALPISFRIVSDRSKGPCRIDDCRYSPRNSCTADAGD